MVSGKTECQMRQKNPTAALQLSDITLHSLPFYIHRLCTLPYRSGRMFCSLLTKTKGGVYLLGFKTPASQTEGCCCCCILLCTSQVKHTVTICDLTFTRGLYNVCDFLHVSGFAKTVSTGIHCISTLKQIFS